MKLLLDSCVWGKAKDELILLGHDVIWAGDWDYDPGDDEILLIASRENRVLITLDKDFGELIFLKKQIHSGIIRIVNISVNKQAIIINSIIEKYSLDLEKNAIITVDSQKTRIRF